MNLEQKELVELANLKESFGFQMLLDRLQAEIDDVQQDILDPLQPINKEKISYWRSLYRIMYIFKTVPEEMTKELKKIQLETNYSEEQENLTQVPKEYLDYLLKEYEKRKKNNK